MIFTPTKITPQILNFCYRIVSNPNPILLNVEPLKESEPLECFVNVEKVVAKKGGSIQYGWRIGEWSEVMLEAEFHAVWLSPEKNYVDITPFIEKQILFLPDNSRVYEGKQINSFRFPLINNPLLLEFIDVNNKIFEVMNSGKLAEKHGRVSIPANLIMPLRKRHQELLMMLYRLKSKPNSPCFCGSGLKYKKCCKE